MEYIWDNIGKIASLVAVIGSIGIFVVWIVKIIKKPDSNTEKRFSAEDVNILTEQARESEKKRVEENLENFGVDLKKSGNHAGAKKLAEAQEALANNELSKADKLFAEIEAGEELALLKFADISFARGYIADKEIRWKDAAQHYTRAAEIDPCFETLLRAQKLTFDAGNYDSSLSFALQAQKAALAESGKDSKDYNIAINNLAGLYSQNKNYQKAETLYKESLENRIKNLGEHDTQTAISLNNLGDLYSSQEQYEKAKLFYEEALDICAEDLEKNHPHIAAIMNNLAGVYLENKEYKKAEEIYQKALKIRQELLGNDHPYTAKCFNNLAGLYSKQGQYKKAEPFARQAVEIIENVFSHDHPDTKLFKDNYEKIQKEITSN